MNLRVVKDILACKTFLLITLAATVLLVPLAASLFLKSRAVLAAQPLGEILCSTVWQPSDGKFGLLAFIAGTVSVTLLAMLIAAPISLLTAIYLTEYAPRALRKAVLPVIDVLSGIPSVIYGVWGLLLIVPAVEKLAGLCGSYSSGYCLLSGALVLAVMVCPFIIHVTREILASVPDGLREASMSLGATRWETTKHVVLRKAFPGIVAAMVFGLSRAMGETIAVLMVVGNVPMLPRSVFDPVYPLPALMANNYGEMMSIPLYDSALLFSALVLLVIVAIFNLVAKLTVRTMYKGG